MDRWSILYLNVNKEVKKGKKKQVIIENSQIVFTRKPKLSLNTSFGCVCVNWEKQVKWKRPLFNCLDSKFRSHIHGLCVRVRVYLCTYAYYCVLSNGSVMLAFLRCFVSIKAILHCIGVALRVETWMQWVFCRTRLN